MNKEVCRDEWISIRTNLARLHIPSGSSWAWRWAGTCSSRGRTSSAAGCGCSRCAAGRGWRWSAGWSSPPGHAPSGWCPCPTSSSPPGGRGVGVNSQLAKGKEYPPPSPTCTHLGRIFSIIKKNEGRYRRQAVETLSRSMNLKCEVGEAVIESYQWVSFKQINNLKGVTSYVKARLKVKTCLVRKTCGTCLRCHLGHRIQWKCSIFI